MDWIRVLVSVIVCVSAIGCRGQSDPSPVGVWTVRHELKRENPESEDNPILVGLSTSILTLAENGTFTERLQVDLFEDAKPEPVNYHGVWQQDGNVIRFKRDGGDSTDSYVIDEQGLRMTGNVAGLEIILTRQLEKPGASK